MATPYDAPYKIEQRNLRMRAEPKLAAQPLPRDSRGCFVNQERRYKRDDLLAFGGRRQFKRNRSVMLRAAREAA